MSVREALMSHLNQTGCSQRAVATSIGISASAISQYLQNKYPGDLEALERKITQYLKLSLQREEYPRLQFSFIETSVVKQVHEIATACHTSNHIGIVTGESGLGKTTAVKRYLELNPDVLVIYGRPSITTKSILKEIALKVNADAQGSVDDVFLRIVRKLKGSGRMLIIDEAEHLTARVLDQLRRLNDSEFAGIGILLVGLPRLLQILCSQRGDHKYLYSRVGWNVAVQALTDSDCQNFVASALPSAKNLWRTYADCARRNARSLRNLLARSLEIATINRAPIDAELIRQTSKILIN